MKKTILALAALATLSFTACQKEEAPFVKSFKISNESCTYQGAKTQIAPDGHNVYWTSGDQIKISSVVSSDNDFSILESIYQVTPTAADPTRFEATYVSGYQVPSLDGTVGFLYPASYSSSVFSMTFPHILQSATGGIDNIPMIGIKNSGEVRFFHYFGLLKLNLTKPGVSVDSISVTTDKAIWGDNGSTLSNTWIPLPSVGVSEFHYPVATECDNPDNKSIVLQIDTPQDITTAKDFYISLPEGEFSTFVIRIYTTDHRVATMTASGTISIERAKITTVTAGPSLVFSAVDPS